MQIKRNKIFLFIGLFSVLFLLPSIPASAQSIQGEPSVELISPNGGEIFDPSADITVTWKQYGVDSVLVSVVGGYGGGYSSSVFSKVVKDKGSLVESITIPAGTLKCLSENDYKVRLEGLTSQQSRINNPSIPHRVTDESDSGFFVHYKNTDDTSDVRLSVIEPLEKKIIRWKEKMKVRFEYNHISTFSIGFTPLNGQSSVTQGAMIDLGNGLGEMEIEAIGSSDNFNSEHKVSMIGVTNINKCKEFSNIKKDGFVTKTISTQTIFFVGYPSISIKEYPSKFLDAKRGIQGSSFDTRLPISWTQSGEIETIDIDITPIVHRKEPQYSVPVIKNFTVPKKDMPFANEGFYEWQIPADFPADRYEYTISGYDPAGKKIISQRSSVFDIVKKQKSPSAPEPTTFSSQPIISAKDQNKTNSESESIPVSPVLLEKSFSEKLSVKIPPPAIIPEISPKIEQPPVTLLEKSLKVGARGNDVALLQTFLIEKKFLRPVPKGYFGSLTKTALKKYQKAAKLKQTGWLDTATQNHINALISR